MCSSRLDAIIVGLMQLLRLWYTLLDRGRQTMTGQQLAHYLPAGRFGASGVWGIQVGYPLAIRLPIIREVQNDHVCVYMCVCFIYVGNRFIPRFVVCSVWNNCNNETRIILLEQRYVSSTAIEISQ